MRKHSVRKWLHAILDLLPVIILPIFAIYSHRHTIDSYEVTVSQNEVVDFNQLAQPIMYDEEDFVLEYNSNNSLHVEGTIDFNYLTIQSFESIDSHIYYVKGVDLVTDEYYLYINNPYSLLSSKSTFVGNGSVGYINLYVYNGVTLDFDFYFQIYDLTQMFGSGNEPTIQQFDTWYPNNYYAYDTGTKQLLKDVSTVTYDNSDIGSQMIYSLYMPINDYFNLNNVFNFGAIYDWFELNMFNGNASLSFFIVWNIIVYEFIMDIIFLIYSVFMFVIDFACDTLDRFTGWAKRGD